MIEYGKYQNMTAEDIETDLRAQGLQPIRDEDPAGTVYEPHTHEKTINIIVVLSGEMFVTIKGIEGTLRAGDQVTFPAKTVHSSKIGPEGCSYLWVETAV